MRRCPGRRGQVERRGEAGRGEHGLHVARRDVGRLAHAERDYATRAPREAMPVSREPIVRVDDGRALGPERLEHLALAAGNAFEAAEALEMRRAGIGDEADRGFGQRGQVRDFAAGGSRPSR